MFRTPNGLGSLCVLVSAAFLALTVTAGAQSDDPAFIQGLKPYGAYHGGDIDTVSLENGKVDLHATLLSYPQRGDLQMNFTIRYNNPAYSITQICTHFVPPATCTQYGYDSGIYEMGPIPDGVSVVPDFAEYSLNVAALGMPDGSAKPMGITSGGGNWTAGNVSAESLDATGWAVTNMSWTTNSNGVLIPNGVVVSPNGTRVTLASGTGVFSEVEDRNGNQITGNGSEFKDSLGRFIPYPPTAQGGTPGNSALCPTTYYLYQTRMLGTYRLLRARAGRLPTRFAMLKCNSI
jgi:hypothetical protein